MSAIGGVVAFSEPESPISVYVSSIFSRLPHRGKQDEGYVFFHGNRHSLHAGEHTAPAAREAFGLQSYSEVPGSSWMGIGHRLGSIFSHQNTQAHQPFKSHDGRLWVVLDGEIFNTTELAKELRSENVTLETDDQVELLAKGFLHWQERILSRLTGSFSFFIYDTVENRCFAARDPFGIRPFYFVHSDEIFAFASELKALIDLPFVSKKVSKSAVFDYLILGNSENNVQTMFRGLSELMPGHAISLVLPRGTMKIWSYFQMVSESKLDRYSRNKVSTLSHRLRKSLVQNVSNHLTPGYPSAYRFNRELESYVFPFLLRESIWEMQAQQRPKASDIYRAIHSSIYENDPEFGFAQDMSQDLGVEMIRSQCSFRDFMESLESFVHLQDLPFVSLEAFGQFQMAKAAREKGICIIFEPTGGQQLFSTHVHHFSQFLGDLLDKGQYSTFLENLINAPINTSQKLGFLTRVGKGILFKSTADDLKESILRRNQQEFGYIKESFKDRYAKNLENSVKNMPSSLNQLLINELGGSLVKEQLRLSDRTGNFHGIEIRAPFMSDLGMAESMIKANSVYKIRSGQSGMLLRKALKGIYPENLFLGLENSRRQSGQNNWLVDAKEQLREYITPDLDDFVDSRALRKDWDNLFSSQHPDRQAFLWRVVNLGIWRKVYFH